MKMFEVTNFTKKDSPYSESFFNKVKESILGKKYDLSLVFAGDQRAQNLNRKFRKKNYVPNVLSFPLDKSAGEIFINLNKISKETKKFDMNFKKLTLFMFIHGCLHLKGYEHGEKMEKEEQKFLQKFGR